MARSFRVSGVDIIRTLRQAEQRDTRSLARRVYEKLRRKVMADHLLLGSNPASTSTRGVPTEREGGLTPR